VFVIEVDVGESTSFLTFGRALMLTPKSMLQASDAQIGWDLELMCAVCSKGQ
jgi:hypothetical protein